MALLTYADRVAETTTTTGTGTIQLGGAVDGKFRTFVAGAGSGNTVPYVVVHRTANEWEVGYGVVTSGSPDTLTRAGVYSSSNGGSAVNFSAGTKDVFLGLPAGKTVTFDDTTGAVTIASATVSGNTILGQEVFRNIDNGILRIAGGNPAATGAAILLSGSTHASVPGRLYLEATGTGNFIVRTGGTDRLTVDASGNLGLGVTPSALSLAGRYFELGYKGNGVLSVSDGTSFISNAYYDGAWKYGYTGAAAYYANSAGQHRWYTAPSGTAGNAISFTQAMTLDASGNLGVGATTTDPYSLGSTGRTLALDSSGASVGSLLSISSAGTRRAYLFANSVNTVLSSYANIPLVFNTNDTERARITAGGEFLVNATATVNASIASVVGTASTNVLALKNGDNGNYFLYCANTANAEQLRIEGDGDVYNLNGTYGTISDAKLKQDITDAGSQWDDLKAIRFRKYRFTSDVEQKGEDAPYLLGVVAQELQAVSPGLVDAHPDTEQVEVEVEVEKTRPVMHEVEEVVTDAEGVESVVTKSVPMLDEDGQPVTETYTETETRTETRQTGTETLSVKQSILLMKAAVALQEAMARIETLEARLAALEAK